MVEVLGDVYVLHDDMVVEVVEVLDDEYDHVMDDVYVLVCLVLDYIQ